MDRMVNFKETTKTLPVIREDLKLYPTSPGEDGSKRWLIYDPVQNRYFDIGEDTFYLISHWINGAKSEEFLKKLQENDYHLELNDLEIFIDFISKNGLSVSSSNLDTKRFAQMHEQRKQSFFKWLLKNYLFIRIPLIKPNDFLESTKHIAEFFYSKYWQYSVLVIGFIGILMTLRNWENFSSTFLYFFSQEGLLYYGISLIFVKSLHELGHAYTAKRHGCNIPSMGVSFLVLFPVLYTDTTDSWKLHSKYERLKIVLAGVKVELYLALIATFLWSFLSDGSLKSIAFIIATTSWITSVLINISPFLRFDGYYALSDWSNSKNLQPRSFALAKWYLRKNVLGLQDEAPENLKKNKKYFFIIYAFLTWIYRFFLFLGIAFMVYYFTFKVLGIILFIVEIIWFILLPVYKELEVWWSKKEQIHWNNNTVISSSAFLFLVILLFTPWYTTVHMPAVLESQVYANLYSTKSAKIEKILVKNDDIVKKGQVLIILKSDEIDYELNQVIKQIELLNLKIKRFSGISEFITEKFVLEEQLLLLYKQKDGLVKTKDKLTIKASFDAKVSFPQKIDEGVLIDSSEPLISLYDVKNFKISAFCLQREVKNLTHGQDVIFMDNSGTYSKIIGTIKKTASFSEQYLEFPELSSDFQGSIATRLADNKRLKTEQVYYKVTATVDNTLSYTPLKRVPGVLITKGKATNIAEEIFINLVTLLIKESEF
jgi:putative peptide zinc metalloprotease protein